MRISEHCLGGRTARVVKSVPSTCVTFYVDLVARRGTVITSMVLPQAWDTFLSGKS